MLVIDREKSNLTWVYKLLDGIDIKILEDVKENMNRAYLIKYHGSLYIFSGKIEEPYKNYIGFETNENELKNYNNNLFKIFNEDMKFNFDVEETI